MNLLRWLLKQAGGTTTVRSTTLDYYLELGIAVDQVQRAMNGKHVEVTLQNGRFIVNDYVAVVGCLDIEPNAETWRQVAQYVSRQ